MSLRNAMSDSDYSCNLQLRTGLPNDVEVLLDRIQALVVDDEHGIGERLLQNGQHVFGRQHAVRSVCDRVFGEIFNFREYVFNYYFKTLCIGFFLDFLRNVKS